MLTALLLVLIVLWLLGFLRPGNLDFLRATVLPIGAGALTVLDLLVVFAVLWLIVALRGPLAIAIGVLLALWAMSIAGLIAFEGVPLSLLIVLVMIVGVTVHVLTRRPA